MEGARRRSKILKFGAKRNFDFSMLAYFWDLNFQIPILNLVAFDQREINDMELGGREGTRWISFRASGNKT